MFLQKGSRKSTRFEQWYTTNVSTVICKVMPSRLNSVCTMNVSNCQLLAEIFSCKKSRQLGRQLYLSVRKNRTSEGKDYYHLFPLFWNWKVNSSHWYAKLAKLEFLSHHCSRDCKAASNPCLHHMPRDLDHVSKNIHHVMEVNISRDVNGFDCITILKYYNKISVLRSNWTSLSLSFVSWDCRK